MLTECEVNGLSECSTPSPSPPSPIPSSHQSSNPDTTITHEDVPIDIMPTTIRQELEAEIDKLKREVGHKEKEAGKEKEMLVMRYANSEKEIIKLRRDLDTLQKSLQNSTREADTLTKKTKMLATERERLLHMVDTKVCEIQALQKELERLKEDNTGKDFKIKWIQNKLNLETDAHKECITELEKCKSELEEAKNEANCMRNDCQDMINSYQKEIVEEDGGSMSAQNNIQLNPFQKEIQILKGKHRALIQENNFLSFRVQSLQEERLDLEQKLSRLQESNADHLHQIASLQSDLVSAEALRPQLLREEERVTKIQNECEQLREWNSELMADMTLCRGKEAELLAYTQQVTEKNVILQSEFTSVETKDMILEDENRSLISEIQQLQNELKGLEKECQTERKKEIHERLVLVNELELEREKRLELERQLQELNGDIVLMKKKHETSLRELTKELKIAIRRDNGSGDGMSQSSRTSSTTSLNNLETSSQSPKPHQTNQTDSEFGGVIPDQNVLVEGILKLQRRLFKKQEKNEFLEEYAKELRETAQKQRKIIQAYAMNQEAGALTSDISDQNKQIIGNVIRAEFVKHGGIMGSVYGSRSTDEGLTFELSLQINRKLHALLEDTLLKNITLKDNLCTLGEENSKLTNLIRDMKRTIQGNE